MDSNKIELLAPAGNREALHAAIASGADAVYLGLDAFNARRNADNFTLESFEEACAYAHLRGASVYVTLNTVILPGEMDEALEYARQAYRLGADAFIVQDIGLASELVRVLPEARLHISTQMNTMNTAGIRAAARLGARRVTLARELSLPEIAACAREAALYDMEIETFVHGALCICASGQCFMSSMIGGRSANRGMCAQACRLPYALCDGESGEELAAPGEYLLSPKDLCAAHAIPELIEAGVTSFKIEGRMKSPDYVATVTDVYRRVVDRASEALRSDTADRTASASASHSDEVVLPQEQERLDEAFSRGFTEGYLRGLSGNDIMSYQRPNNRGVSLGKVTDVKPGRIVFKAGRETLDGDVLEIWTGKGHAALTVEGLRDEGKGKVSCALPSSLRGVKTGDRVFRVRKAPDASAVVDAFAPRIPLRAEAELRIGRPLVMRVRVDDSAAGLYAAGSSEGSAAPVAQVDPLTVEDHIVRRLLGRFHGSLPEVAVKGAVVEAARTKAVGIDDVAAHIDRLGQTPYTLRELDIELDEGVGIGFSALHHIRAQALDELTDALLEGTRHRRLERKAARPIRRGVETCGCSVAVFATNPSCARAAKRAGADTVYVPVINYVRGNAQYAGLADDAVGQAGYPKHCVLAMPVEDHESVGDSRENAVGFDAWRHAETSSELLVENLAAMERASEEGIPFDVGAHLPVLNAAACETVAEFGARRVWLSPELTLRQIGELTASRPLGFGLCVVGAQELMTTEHCLLMSQGPCSRNCAACSRRKRPHILRDRKGFGFPVMTDPLGRSHLYNSVRTDTVHAIPELLGAGVTSFMVDATLMDAEQTAQAVGRVVRALRVAQSDGNSLAKMPGTTTGHLFRGVS